MSVSQCEAFCPRVDFCDENIRRISKNVESQRNYVAGLLAPDATAAAFSENGEFDPIKHAEDNLDDLEEALAEQRIERDELMDNCGDPIEEMIERGDRTITVVLCGSNAAPTGIGIDEPARVTRREIR